MKSWIQTTFGKRLKLLRDAVGATQDQMAKVLNVSRSTYSYYELGESSPPLDKLRNIVLMLGRDKADFLLGVGESANIDLTEERFARYSSALLLRDAGPLDLEDTREDFHLSELYPELQELTFRSLTKDEQMFLLWYRVLDAKQRESLFQMLQDLKYPPEESGEEETEETDEMDEMNETDELDETDEDPEAR